MDRCILFISILTRGLDTIPCDVTKWFNGVRWGVGGEACRVGYVCKEIAFRDLSFIVLKEQIMQGHMHQNMLAANQLERILANT